MMNLNPTIQKYLLNLARTSIRRSLENTSEPFEIDADFLEQNMPELLKEYGVFVAVSDNDKLLNCEGNISSVCCLAQNLANISSSIALSIENLSKNDTTNLTIEIWIVESYSKLEYIEINSLFKFISEEKPGLAVFTNNHFGSLLPSAWETFDTPKLFLEELFKIANLEESKLFDKDTQLFSFKTFYFK